MKVDVLDTKGKKVEQIELSKDIFGVEPNRDLLAQYIRIFQTNQRQGTSKVKNRSEVSGGGKKPWRQKGTGRARHGSSRSPIWTKGGITHGPIPKNYNLKFPKKMRRLALLSALSVKANDKNIKILSELKFKQPKTKEMVEILSNLKTDRRVLIVTNGSDLSVVKSAKNIPFVEVSTQDNLNAFDLIKAKDVIFVKDAVTGLQERLIDAK